MSISETTLTRIIDAGEHADDVVRQVGRVIKKGDAAPAARALGWFSIGLGAAEVLAPARMAQLTGTEGYEPALQLFGLREIASGVGILAGTRPAPGWVWARVAGDAMDLALLGRAAASNDSGRGRIGIAAAAVAGVALLDLLCARRLATG